MQTIATEDILENLNFFPDDEAQEIAQNIAVLMATPKGSVPLARGMGLSMRYKDFPPRVAQMMFESELADAISQYEERAELSKAEAEITEDGDMKMKVGVNFNGG